MTTIIKVFGLPRTCTNVFEVAMQRNFDCKVLTNFPCGKHYTFCEAEFGRNADRFTLHSEARGIYSDDVKIVLCTKEPRHWLSSFHDYDKRSFPRHGIAVDKWIQGKSGFYSELPCESYNRLHDDWLQISDNPNVFQIVRQEDMTATQVTRLEQLEQQFGLTRRNRRVLPVRETVRQSAKVRDKKFSNRGNTLPQSILPFVYQSLNPYIVANLGYPKVAQHCQAIQTGTAKVRGQ